MRSQMEMSPEEEAKFRRIYATYTAGLTAINIVILQAFISVGIPDIASIISVSAIAISLPLLVTATISFNFTEDKPLMTNRKVSAMFYVGILVSPVGIAAALYHISWIACVLFVASAFIAYLLYPGL